MITKAFPLQQPFADWLLYEGLRKVQVRWSTAHRGLAFVYAAAVAATREGLPLPRGGLVGVVNILDCEPHPEGGSVLHLGNPQSMAFVGCGGQHCAWQLAPDIATRANEALQEAVDVG